LGTKLVIRSRKLVVQWIDDKNIERRPKRKLWLS